jgi:Holliday junction resolvasome RuvABC DNA-binding subunit
MRSSDPAEEPLETFHVENVEQNISEVATFQTDAVLALKTLGFTKELAAGAVREALEHDAPHDGEALFQAALRRCNT